MRIAINGLIGLLTLAYPLAVYFGIQYVEPRMIAVILLALLALRLASRAGGQWMRPLLITGMLYCGFAIWANNLISLRFYPALVSAGMLLIFAWSLWSPQPLIERLARLQHPDLPPEGVVYTRRVTQVWCAFFAVNGLIALATALWGSFEQWSLYNGLISYLLTGALLGGEYIVRLRTQKHVR
jgi:uncharacterized membrane protein